MECRHGSSRTGRARPACGRPRGSAASGSRPLQNSWRAAVVNAVFGRYLGTGARTSGLDGRSAMQIGHPGRSTGRQTEEHRVARDSESGSAVDMHSDNEQTDGAASPSGGRARFSRRQALGRMSAVAGAGAAAWVVPEILTAKPAAGATLSGGTTGGGGGTTGGTTGGVATSAGTTGDPGANGAERGQRGHDRSGDGPRQEPGVHRARHQARRADRRCVDRRRMGHAALGQPHTQAGRGRPDRDPRGGERGRPGLSDRGVRARGGAQHAEPEGVCRTASRCAPTMSAWAISSTRS